MADLVEVWRYQGGFSLSHDLVYGVAVAADKSVFLLGFQLDNYGTSGSDFAGVKIDADGDIIWEWKELFKGVPHAFCTIPWDLFTLSDPFTIGPVYNEDVHLFLYSAIAAKEGSDGNDAFFSAAAVADGVVGGGYFNGTWNEVSSAGGADFAVIKLYSNSSVAWRWHEGTDEDDVMSAAVQTVDGNVVVAGYTQGSWNETSNGWHAVAAAKLDADDGEVMTEATTGEGKFVRAAAVRGDGSVVLGGFSYRAITTTSGEDDWATDFLALALDEYGNELWRWQDGPGTGHSFVTAIAAFDDGSVLLAGTTEKSWLVDGLKQGNFSVAKLTASGYLEWSWQNGTMFDDEFAGAAIGINDSVILSGFTSGSWAGTQAGNQFDKDFVAMSINAEGDILWRYQAGTTADDVFNDVAVRPDGLIVLGGWTVGYWTAPETSDSYADFAAVLLNASSSISITTPSPTKDSSSRIKGSKHSKDTNSGDSAGLIVGSSIGGVAVFAILVACCFCSWNGGRHTRKTNPPGSSSLPAAPAPIAPGRHVSNVAVARVIAINPQPAYTDPPPDYSAVA